LRWVFLALFVAFGFVFSGNGYASVLNLEAEELVRAGGAEVQVNGYSVPSYVDWDGDGKKDLVVGEGGGGYAGKVRVYLNSGTATSPAFSDFFYAESNGAELEYSDGCNCTCLGLFPRVVNWNGDGRKDLLTGRSDGTVALYLNTATDSEPSFDGGTLLQVGPAGSKVDLSVVARATSSFVDWDGDGSKDLVAGAYDGKIHLFLDQVTDTEPDFVFESIVYEDGEELVVPGERSSPMIYDLDGDGKKDILTGNTDGQLLFYQNIGTDDAPVFSGYSFLESEGAAIDLEGEARSRPFVCDWTNDGYLDILVGSGDGNVHLYQGVPEPGTVVLFGVGFLVFLRRRRF